MVERKRRTLADTLRAVDPLAGLQGTALIMRLISSPNDPAEKLNPKKTEAKKNVNTDVATTPTPQVSSVSPSPASTEPTVWTLNVLTAPTETTYIDSTELTELTELTEKIYYTPTVPNEPTGPSEPSELTKFKNPLLGLAPSRLVFLDHVLKHRGRFDREFVSWAQVSRETGLSLSAIKRLTKDLSERGIIRVEFDHLQRKGSRVYLIEDYAKSLTGLFKHGHNCGTTARNDMTELTEPTWKKWYEPTVLTRPTAPTPIEDKKIKNLNLSKTEEAQRLLAFTDEQIKFQFPNLNKICFGVDQLRQIILKLEATGKSPDKLQLALEHANFEWGRSQPISLTDSNGKPILKPLDYVFSTLARTGYYRRPEGYISPEEQAELDQEAELRALANVRERVEQAKFEGWLAKLTDKERERIFESRPGYRTGRATGSALSAAELAWLRTFWGRHGRHSSESDVTGCSGLKNG